MTMNLSCMHLHQYTQEIKAGYHPNEVAESRGGFSEAPPVHSLSRDLSLTGLRERGALTKTCASTKNIHATTAVYRSQYSI